MLDHGTKAVLLAGYPLEFTISPVIHNAAYRDMGLNLIYLSSPVRAEKFKTFITAIRDLDFVGANVTVPHKLAASKEVDELEDDAKLTLSVNTIVKRGNGIIGYNTDVEGFTIALRSIADKEYHPEKAFVTGAGGAARAVIFALIKLGTRKIYVFNRTESRAKELKRSIEKATGYNGLEVLEYSIKSSLKAECCDLFVNTASPQKAEAFDMPFHLKAITKEQVVIDINYGNESIFLKRARQVGAVCGDGLEMLVWQAALAIEIWINRKPPISIMREAGKKEQEAYLRKGRKGLFEEVH